MPKIVQPRPTSIIRPAQSDLMRDTPELPVYGTDAQGRSSAGDEQALQDNVRQELREEPVTVCDICAQRLKPRGVQRNQTRLPKLRLTNREHAFLPIDFLVTQVPHFAQTH